ncbi:MAG: hypothetical protein QXU18_11875 [Thermoplasmatales archaeon]
MENSSNGGAEFSFLNPLLPVREPTKTLIKLRNGTDRIYISLRSVIIWSSPKSGSRTNV